jgi:hypothetical protein
MRFACFATVLAAVVISCPVPSKAHDHAVLRGRLVFADHEKPVVRVLDLDSGEVTHEFPVGKANPGFATLEGGRFIVVKTGDDAGTLRFLDSGLRYETHGDHVDVDKGDVRLLDFALTGERPAHIVSKNGQTAFFYDGKRPWEGRSEPKAVFLRTGALADKSPKTAIWTSPAPQHGIAVPLGKGQALLSQPNPIYAKGEDRSASSRPNGFIVASLGKGWKTSLDLNDSAKADASCKLYHGYAETKGRHAFACAEGEGGGLLMLAREGKGFAARKLAYPDKRRVSTLRGAGGGAFLVGNYGLKAPYDALIRIDPEARALTIADVQSVPGGQSACQFELSPGGRQLANLTPDGKLRIWELAPAWKELAVFDAVPAFDCQYGAKTPTPGLAIVGASAFVSDPTNGRIREYHIDTLKQGLDMPVGGMPANLAGGGDAG